MIVYYILFCFSECIFPSDWHGRWFHLGFPEPLNITKNLISNKGKCVHNENNQYIMEEK